MTVGEKLTVKIEGKGSRGDPYFHAQSLMVFVKSPEVPLDIGEEVTVEISAITVNCAFAKVV